MIDSGQSPSYEPTLMSAWTYDLGVSGPVPLVAFFGQLWCFGKLCAMRVSYRIYNSLLQTIAPLQTNSAIYIMQFAIALPRALKKRQPFHGGFQHPASMISKEGWSDKSCSSVPNSDLIKTRCSRNHMDPY